MMKSKLCRVALLGVAALLFAHAASGRSAETAAAASTEELAESVKYLSSDELEGRGVGTGGLNKAAEFIAAEFEQAGLQTKLIDGGPFQRFSITTSAEMGPKEDNRMKLVAPQRGAGEAETAVLELGRDFNPLAIGGSGKIDAPLVFAGYGITSSKEPEYDDYAGLDVKGKAVIILRKEPQQSDPHSRFNGTENTQHALFSRKVSNAFQHGAAAVLFVNDGPEIAKREEGTRAEFLAALERIEKLAREYRELSAREDAMPEVLAKKRLELRGQSDLIDSLSQTLDAGRFDAVLGLGEAGDSNQRRGTPVFFVRRGAIEPVIQDALGKSLAEIETEIDKSLEPKSAALAGWKVEGRAELVRNEVEIKNVIGVLEGEGPLADETVVVGAHYDHLGFGGPGSLAPWTTDVHNGADDNASGTAVLLEVARLLAARSERPPRRIVFIAFTGEERGLLGSARYVREPRFPLDDTVAMINMDMVGRLKDDKLTVFGTGTAESFDALIDRLAEKHGFDLSKKPGGFGPSDHSSFYGKKIPVFHLFTGTHGDYHRPSDDFENLNVEGMRQVSELVVDLVDAIASDKERPKYVAIKQRESPDLVSGDRPYTGTIPDFGGDEPGYAISGVAPGSPAEQAELKGGDVIVKFGESKIGSLEDYDGALRQHKAGEKVKVVVKRGGEEVELTITLGAPR